jgi:hypothetical protein
VLTRAVIPVKQAYRTALGLAGPAPSPGSDEAGVPVQATASAGVGRVSSPLQLEEWIAELRERERVLRLREEALRRREGRVTDTEIDDFLDSL